MSKSFELKLINLVRFQLQLSLLLSHQCINAIAFVLIVTCRSSKIGVQTFGIVVKSEVSVTENEIGLIIVDCFFTWQLSKLNSFGERNNNPVALLNSHIFEGFLCPCSDYITRFLNLQNDQNIVYPIDIFVQIIVIQRVFMANRLSLPNFSLQPSLKGLAEEYFVVLIIIENFSLAKGINILIDSRSRFLSQLPSQFLNIFLIGFLYQIQPIQLLIFWIYLAVTHWHCAVWLNVWLGVYLLIIRRVYLLIIRPC